MDPRPEIGRRGEAAAARHLTRRGWELLATRWRGGGGELDIVARRAGVLAVCEVKVRRDDPAEGSPVTVAQRERILAAAAALLVAPPHHADHAVQQDQNLVGRAAGRRRVRHLPRALEW